MKKFLLVFSSIFLTIVSFGQYLSESFEGTWSGTPVAPSGWTNIDGVGSTNKQWEKATYSAGAWTPAGSGTYKPAGAVDGTAVAHYNDYNASTGQTDKLQTPLVNLSGAINPRLSFYYTYPYTSWSGSFKVYGSNDGGTSWNLLGTYSFTSTVTTWTKVVIPLSSYLVSNAKFSFEVSAGYGYADLWFDKVVIDETPAPLTGIKTIKASGGDYSSFSAAINALNDAGVGSGGVTFNVDAGLVTTEDCPFITATGTSSNPIVFQKSGSGSNPVIKPTGTTGSVDAGIAIAGGDYITFDGIDITIATGSALEFGYYIYNTATTNGAQYNTIKNCKITLNRGNTSSRAIYQFSAFAPSAATGANSYAKFQGITVENAYQGIYIASNATWPDLNIEVSGCIIGGSAANDIGNGSSTTNGIRASSVSGISIFNNEVRNITVTGAVTLYGIYIENLQGTVSNVYSNKVHDLKSTSTSSTSLIYGIRTDINSSMTCNVYNNMIYALFHGTTTAISTQVIRAIAVGVSGAGTGNFYYNSVRIDEDQYPSSACFYIGGGTINAKDNIFANFSTAGATSKRHCIYRNAGTLSGVNYNDYYIASGTNNFVGYFTTDQSTLANWQTASGKDANSLNVDPGFISTSDLHSASASINNLGVAISTGLGDAVTITTDIDGETRGATPDIGADEFTPLTCGVPGSLASSNIAYQSADLSWAAPGGGSPVGYQWEVRTSGAGGSGATGLVSSGNTVAPTTTTSVSGLSGGTTYYYYVRTDCGSGDYSLWAGNSFITVACNLPTGVAASGVTATGATISWSAPAVGSPTGYEWEVRTSGAAGSGATGLAASGSTSSPTVTATVSGLTPSTTHYIYIRSVCYSGFNSSWTTSVAFTTQCNPEVAPTVVQDFSTYTGSAPAPTCWSEATGTLAASSTLTYGTSEWTNSTGFANTGTNKGVKVNLWSSGSDWIISQPIDLGSTAGLFRIKYNMAVTGYNNTNSQSTLGTHRVDVVVSTDGGTTWSNTNIIKTYTGAGTYSNTGQIQTIDLTAYSGVVKIAFVETTTSSTPDIDFHFDDFVVEAIPSCFEPTSLTASVTLTSATLYWAAPASGTPIGYNWEVRTSGAGGSGSTGLVASGSTLAGVTTANVSGLTSNTSYYFYVRTDCGSGNNSPWAGGSFYTGYCTPAPTSVDGSGIINVTFSSVNNTTGVEPGNYGNYSAMIGDVQQGVSVPVSITFATGYTYDTKIWIDWNDNLVFTDSGEEVYSGTSLNNNPTTLSASFTVPISATLGNHRMRIGGVDVGPPTPCYTGTYGSFEDYTVNVLAPPSCPAPTAQTETDITASSAVLSWTESGSSSTWDIEYGIYGFIPTGIPSAGFDNLSKNDAVDLPDLNSATTYSWYVRADCGGDNESDVSSWTGPHSFTTLCLSVNVPYSQDFESITVPAIPVCHSIENAGLGNNWLTANNPGSGFTTKVLKYPYNATYAANAWFYTPGINLTAGTAYRLTFKYGNNSTTYVEKLKVAYGVSPVNTDMTTVLLNFPNINQNALQNASVDFVAASSGVFYFGFNCYSAIDQFNLYVDDILIDAAPTTTTWTGAVSNSWGTSGNWSSGLPGTYTDVIIPGGLTNYPTLTASGWVRNFTIQSSAAGTGSILGNNYLNISGTTSVERYLTKYNVVSDYMFHFLSSPVSAQAIVPEFQTLSSTNTDFYKWGETNNLWINSLSAPGTWNSAFESNMTVGSGYLVAYPADLTKAFTGALNDGAISPALTYTLAGSSGWNLVGNPYPSAIDWDLVSSMTGLDNAVYVWDNANQNYKEWVAGVGDLTDGIIPAMQGFFVKANAASPTLTFQNSQRVHSGSAYYKDGIAANLVELRIDGNSHYDNTYVRFNESTTPGFDHEWDAYKLMGGAAVPNFFSKAGDTKYAVNSLPESSLTQPVALHLVVGADGNYSLNMVNNTLSSSIYVTLEDLKTGTIQRLNNSPVYSFTATTGDDPNRFRLHFKDATSVADPAGSGYTIYSLDGVIHVFTEQATSGKVMVSDMAGRTLASETMMAGTPTRINLGHHTGVYIVSIITSKGSFNEKVLVQ
jgi:hypothetical protein